jgi:hypothetical protein
MEETSETNSEEINFDEYIKTIIEEEEFYLPKRYKIDKIIGVGSYSTVWFVLK